MSRTGIAKAITIVMHAFVLWALCGATMGIAMAVASEATALIIHAAAAPLIAVAVSSVYFRKFNYTTPLQTAAIFVSFVIIVDLFLVAVVILGSLEMFGNLIGTWIPFILIFFSTYLSGLHLNRRAVRMPV